MWDTRLEKLYSHECIQGLWFACSSQTEGLQADHCSDKPTFVLLDDMTEEKNTPAGEASEGENKRKAAEVVEDGDGVPAAEGAEPSAKKQRSDADAAAAGVAVEEKPASVADQTGAGEDKEATVEGEKNGAADGSGDAAEVVEEGKEPAGEEEGEKKREKKSGPVRLGPKTFQTGMDMFTFFLELLRGWSPNYDMNEVSGRVRMDEEERR